MSSKRKPIEYSPQFAPGVFRSPGEIRSELEELEQAADGATPSPFRSLDTDALRVQQDEPESASQAAPKVQGIKQSRSKPTTAPRHRDTAVSTMTPRYRDTTVAQELQELVDDIRRAVKVVGKEAATLRLSAGEKARLADIIYTYKRQGRRTSETEIIRIAVNFILEDYQASGENSVLVKVLDALGS
jgi:hypothetical protein